MTTTIKPRTFVITTVGVNKQTGASTSMERLLGTVGPQLTVAGTPRKRQRLSHLNQDERLMRRKLKNRVAAQLARDRKRDKMTDLEQAFHDMEEQNERLQQENEELRRRTSILSTENNSLRSTLGLGEERSDVKVESVQVPTESAEVQGTQTHPQHGIGHLPLPHSHAQPELLAGLKDIVIETVEPVQKSSFKGQSAKTKTRPAQSLQVVGPSTTELESLRELIKFDHIYYKATRSVEPNRKSEDEKMVVISVPETIKDETTVNVDVNHTNDCRIPMEADPGIDLMKYMDPDMVQSLSELLDIDQLIGSDESNNIDIASLPETDSRTASSITAISPIQTNIEIPQSQPNVVPVISVSKDKPTQNDSSIVYTQRGSRKRKASSTSTSSVSLDDFLLFPEGDSLLVPGDGVVINPARSPMSLSDYSSVRSPESDVTNNLEDDLWEESFTELFPSLL